MDTPIITASIAGASALLGGGWVALMQWLSASRGQNFQLKLEALKRQASEEEERRATYRKKISTAHRAVSKLGREFSRTSLDIKWRYKMSDRDYDQAFVQMWDVIDELGEIANCDIPEILEHVVAINGEMSMFWGHFKEVLRLSLIDEKHEHIDRFLEKTIHASIKLGTHVRHTQDILGSLARSNKAFTLTQPD